MRGIIGKGLVKSLLGSPCRQLNESICPTTGSTFKSKNKLYGSLVHNLRYVQNGPTGGVPAAVQVWDVTGEYNIYSNQGPLIGLKPYGRWRVSFHFDRQYQKLPAGDARDILKCYLVRYRTDKLGEQIGDYEFIAKSGQNGVIQEKVTQKTAIPTWTFDLTQPTSVFDDFLEIPEQNACCFIAFDMLFSFQDPAYESGTLSGIQPYGTILGGNSNSDPLCVFQPGTIFAGPPPASSGDWVLPVEPFLANGVVDIDGSYGGSTASVFQGLDARYGVGGWGAPRQIWRADFAAQRLSLTALFNWNILNLANVQFNTLSLTQGQPVTYLWDFGDGNTSALANPLHTYSGSGQYLAKLTLTDNLGETSTFNQLVTIPLIADFTFNASKFPINGTLFVSTTNLSVGASTFDWDWGDGSPHSTIARPTHNYLNGIGKTFIITLTVGDGLGKTASISKTVVG